MDKIWGIGEKLYLLMENGGIGSYTVTDIGIYCSMEGNHMMCLKVEDSKGGELVEPFWIIEELMNDGQLWREGSENMTKFLRKRRKNGCYDGKI
jgi:hypothetical protein